MKTSNIEPHGLHAAQATRGSRSGLVAGSKGMTWRDSVTESVGQIRDMTVIGAEFVDNDDGTGLLIIDGQGVTVPGEVTASGSAVAISTGTDHRAFPTASWIDNVGGTHIVGDRILLTYRHGATHLTNGKAVGRYLTCTSTTAWTFSVGSEFDIEDLANDVRANQLSVVRIAGDYTAVVTGTEYDGSVNLDPHILVCTVASEDMPATPSWTRYEIPLTEGSSQNAISGRVIELDGGGYISGAYWVSGATTTTGVIKTTDLTDWSGMTAIPIADDFTEIYLVKMPDGTLRAHIRDVANASHYSSESTDDGDTWSTPVLLYAATGMPTWELLASGLGLAVNRSVANSLDTYYRQTQSGVVDLGWGDEVALDTTSGYHNAYATIVQLDDTHVFVIWAREDDNVDPVDADIVGQILLDSSTVGTTAIVALDDLSDVTITSPAEGDTLRYVDGVWVNDNRRWEPVTTNPGTGPELVWDGDDIVMNWAPY